MQSLRLNPKRFSTFIKERIFDETKYLQFKQPSPLKFLPTFPKVPMPTNFTTQHVWDKTKIRMGVIGVKMGNIGIWDKNGVRHACVVVKLDNLQAIHIPANLDKLGVARIMLGCGQKNWNRVLGSQRKIFENVDVPYKSHIHSFKVSKDGLVPPGTPITVRHFIPGQLIDVKGKTVGKGFQGTIKRHNYKRQSKTHGNSKSHRKPGSQGITGVARVFPGKAGAGRMGGKMATILNLRVMRIDCKQNILFIKGDIPGKKGTYVYMRDAFFKPSERPLPYPTYIEDPYEKELPVLEAPLLNKTDPFEPFLPKKK